MPLLSLFLEIKKLSLTEQSGNFPKFTQTSNRFLSRHPNSRVALKYYTILPSVKVIKTQSFILGNHGKGRREIGKECMLSYDKCLSREMLKRLWGYKGEMV